MYGEGVAVEYLKQNGYAILCRNYRCRFGEIDIVALQGGDRVVFVEVKSWISLSVSESGRALGKRKRERIRTTSEYFFIDFPKYKNCHMRFDLIFIAGNTGEIDHRESVYD